jgi:hypothetical protein
VYAHCKIPAVRLTSAPGGPGCRLVRAVALSAGLLLLAGCSGEDRASDAASAGETDGVQLEAPAEDVAVVVTFADYRAETQVLEVSAYLQGRVETGGACTLTAAFEGETPVAGPPVPAEPGPSTTDCGLLTVPDPDAGTWEVAVEYSSPTTEQTSSTLEVEIP